MNNSRSILLILFLLSAGPLFSSEKDSVSNSGFIDREIQRDEYYLVFAKVPSLLGTWDKMDYAFISTGFTTAKGNYTHPQLLFSRNLVEIKSESVKSLPKKGLRFFGGVSYTNGNAETGEWNLSFNLPENGSPFYYMIQQQGTWKTQSYDFNVAMQKKISNRVSTGIAIKYLGDLHFRTFDSRNENYTLNMQILPSVAIRFGEKSFASLGLILNRIKNEPAIRNKYQHGTEPEKYHLFFNEGLGTWDNSPTQMKMIDMRYGVVASYRKISENKSIDLIYSIYTAKEDWLLKSISTLLNRRENISRYSYLSQDLSFRYLKKGREGQWISNVNLKNTIGTGYIYKESAGIFQDNYEHLSLSADILVSYLKENSIFKRASAQIRFDNSGQNDYNYGHTIDYSNLEGILSSDLSPSKHGAKKGFLFGGFISYKKSLNGSHKPMAAANNFYTTSIAVPAFAYNTSDFYRAGINLGGDFQINQSQVVEIIFKGEILKPVKINNYENFSKFTLKDRYINLYINLIFNF